MSNVSVRRWKKLWSKKPENRALRRARRVRLSVEKCEDRSLPSSSIPLNGFTWTSIGPSPIRDGQSPGNPASSGRLNGVAMDAPIVSGQTYPFPSNPNQIYVASDSGGFWRSIDGGRHWFPQTDFRGGFPTTIASVNRGDNDTVYGSEVLLSGAVLFDRSTDGGVTFVKTNPFPNGTFVEKLSVFVIDPLDQSRDIIYAAVSLSNPFATGQGVYRSTNGGATWTFISTSGFQASSVEFTDVVVHPTNPNIVYAATGNTAGDPNNGIYRSVNALSANPTWTLLIGGSAFVPGSTPGNIKIAVSQSVPSVIFASLALRADPSGGGSPLLGVFRSLDSGVNWTPTLIANPTNQTTDPRNYLGVSGPDNNVILVDPFSPNNPLQQRVYVAGFGGANNVMFSTNSTSNFSTLPPDPTSLIGIGVDGIGPYPNVHMGQIDTFGRFVVATGGGIYRNNSVNPVLWESLNGDIGPNGLQTSQFWGFALHPTNPDQAIGNIMSQPVLLQNAIRFSDPADLSNPDAAYGWNTIDAGTPAGFDGNVGQGTVAYNPFNPSIVYRVVPGNGTRPPIRRSLDGGTTWAAAAGGFQTLPGQLNGIGVSPGPSYTPAFAIDPSRPNRLLSGYNRIFASDDDGNNWRSRLQVNLSGGTIEIPELPTTQLTFPGMGLIPGPIPIDALATGRTSNVDFFGNFLNGAGIFASTPADAFFDPDDNSYQDIVIPGTQLFYAVIPEVNPGNWPPPMTTYDNHYWAHITPPGVAGNITQIIVDPASVSTIYVFANSGQVFRGTDLTVGYTLDDDNNIIPIASINWVEITGNLPLGSSPVSFPQPMALDKRILNNGTQDRLYVGTLNGVFQLDNPTQDFGSGSPVWTEIGLAADGSRTLPAAPVSTLAINTTTGILAAATYGRGVYEIQIRGLIRGRVFDDTNGNGQLNAGEPFYTSTTVTAFNTTTNETFATSTDENGFYEFRSLTPGTYNVQVIGVGSVFQTTIATNALPVTAQTTFDGANQLNIGLFSPGTISGFKYEDKNGNGIRDTDAAGVLEPGLPFFTIFIDRNGNGIPDPGEPVTESGVDGSYRFDTSNVDNGSGLPRGVGPNVIFGNANDPRSGPHAVREVQQPPNFVQTSPMLNVSISSGQNFTGANIGNFRPARISGSKFEDVNGDGIKQAGEGPLAGFLFDLVNVSTGNVVQTVASDADGNFRFLSLPAGTYRVREQAATGYTQTTPNPADLVLSATSTVTVAPFGNFRNIAITGFKFDDANGNGILNVGEQPLANFQFQLINSLTGQVLATTFSNASGNFSFANRGPLANGAQYRVREVVPAGWFQTTADPTDLPVLSGFNSFVVFGNFRGPSVSGTVYNDLNNNGVRNAGEPGLAGFVVQLVRGTTVVASAISVADGTYSIPLVGPGLFQLIVQPKHGFILTAPIGGFAISATSGANLTGRDFGEFRRQITVTSNDSGGAPTVVVRDAQTNAVRGVFNAYSPLFQGGVRIAVGYFNGDSIPDIVTAAGAGGGPHVRVFDGVTFQEITGFMAYELNFTGGVTIAAGDVDGDGIDDIITGTGPGGGPLVKIFSPFGALKGAFFTGDINDRGGITVAAGDVDGDGKADIATGSGIGTPSRASIYRGTNFALLRTVNPYAASFTGGVFVALGDVNGDARADLITGPGIGGGAHVKVYDGASGNQIYSFLAFTGSLGFPWSSGAHVASYDVNYDGLADLILAPGRGQIPRVRVLSGAGLTPIFDFPATDLTFLGGVFVGGG